MGIGFYDASRQWDEDSFFLFKTGPYDMINTWVLVLILGGNNSYKNPEMEIVEGFSSREACVLAGQQVDDISNRRLRFTCVKR